MESDVGDVFSGIRHPLFAQLIQVTHELDRDHAIFSRPDVVVPEVACPVVDDASVRQGGLTNIEVLVRRVLCEVVAAIGHRPKIHRAIAVGDEVDPAIPPHRVVTLSQVVRREFLCFGIAFRVAPYLTSGATGVAFRHVAMIGRPYEEHGIAGGVEAPLSPLTQWESPDGAGFWIDRNQLKIGQGGEMRGGVNEFALGRPRRAGRCLSLIGPTPRQAAFQGHGVKFFRPLVGCGEGNRRSIWRNVRMRFLAGVGRQPPGEPTRQRRCPKITFCAEDNDISVKSWVTVVAFHALGHQTGPWQGDSQY